MKQVEAGEPKTYQELDKPVKSMLAVRGIFKAWQRAPKFILRLQAKEIRMYLSNDGKLTHDKKLAKQFSHGFDLPLVKIAYWSSKLDLKFQQENI